MKSDPDTELALNVFNTEQGQSTTGPNGEFVYRQLLIDCLLRMQVDLTDKEALISVCKEYYKNETRQLAMIDEFQRTYTPSHAIQWYTQESFLYRMLNKALRLQTVDLLYDLRFYIQDLCKQLARNQCASPLCLYRGQLISKAEVQLLQNSCNHLISMNSFLSTSFDRSVAVFYIQDSTEFERVLFEIDADPQLSAIKPFAEISSSSRFPQEHEVLFMVGSIFRVRDVSQSEDKLWNIRLCLASGDDHDLKTLFDHMKIQQNQQNVSLLALGHLLRDMGRFNQAEKYYLRLLHSLPNESPELPHCYHGLGVIAYEQGDCETSLKWHKKALEMKSNHVDSNDPQLVNNYISIGTIFARKKEYEQALNAFEHSLAILRQRDSSDTPKIAICYNNIAGIYLIQKKYTKALEYNRKALAIRRRCLPSGHPDLGVSYNNLGIVYRCSGLYESALENYQCALRIHQNSLPYQHPQIASTLNNTGLVYEDMGDLAQAISYHQRAATIYRHSVPETHPNRIKAEQFLQRVSMKRKSRSDSIERNENVSVQ